MDDFLEDICDDLIDDRVQPWWFLFWLAVFLG